MKKMRIYAVLMSMLIAMACTGCGGAMETNETAPMDSSVAMEAPAKNEIGALPDMALNDIAGDDADGGEEVAYAPEYAEEAEAVDGGDAVADVRDSKVSFGAEADGVSKSMAAPSASPSLFGAMVDDARDMEAINGAAVEDIIDEPIDEPIAEEPDVVAEAGMLTAGEWNDNDNWGFFSGIVNKDLVSFPSYGIDPTQRIAVTVKNESGENLPNAKVQLLAEDGSAIWNAVTNKNGIAYLFETDGKKGASVKVNSPSGAEANATVEKHSDTQSEEVSKANNVDVAVTVADSPTWYNDTQVMFIVDTTGSMGDEMFYLQSDFGSIAEELNDEKITWSVSFYKDTGDEYVVKGENAFSNDPKFIRSQLNAESADGGGDNPEAVAEALTDAFNNHEWKDDTAKVAFLIFDAPPHNEKETEIQNAIKLASEKGIHLVPVVSSNAMRETELFGRAVAICTGAPYVFLTDDSGIGGSHLEPIIGDYEVEKLHDVIVRIINETKQS
ncbi:MAG: VWA domain-containing protein [Oscillospiraceae bacterium]